MHGYRNSARMIVGPTRLQWGVSTDEALLAVNEGIIDKRNQWNLPEGLVVQ
jgi:hypothetical protein